VYSLSDAFAVPTAFVGILLADRVSQSAVEDSGPDDARQEVAQLHVQFVGQGAVSVKWQQRRSCVRGYVAARR